MTKYKVLFYYNENKPPVSDKIFQVSYELEGDNERIALEEARKQFGNYEKSSYASWVRTIIEEKTVIIPEIHGKMMDEYSQQEILEFLEQGDVENSILIVDAIKWNQSLLHSPAIISKINELVKNTDVYLRISCIETLRKNDDALTLKNFFKMLKNEKSVKIRASIIAIIGERKIADMIDVVKEHLKFDDDRVRANAVETLQKIGTKDDIIDLFPLIDDSNNRVRANVMTALWKLGKFYRIEKIEEMLQSESAMMRASAIYALGDIESVECIKLLEKHLNDSSIIVRKNIITSLKKLNSPESLTLLIKCLNEKNNEISEFLYETILSFGDQIERQLLLALQDKDLRWGAYKLLSIIKKQKLSEGKVFDWLFLTLKCWF
ncbi:HEAT repeat domain-containing protein [bacterium]|nr:HEAT repeat domain-containing protein [bacterium]